MTKLITSSLKILQRQEMISTLTMCLSCLSLCISKKQCVLTIYSPSTEIEIHLSCLSHMQRKTNSNRLKKNSLMSVFRAGMNQLDSSFSSGCQRDSTYWRDGPLDWCNNTPSSWQPAGKPWGILRVSESSSVHQSQVNSSNICSEF